MKKGRITFVPAGGLANRMMAMASAYAMTQETGDDLNVIWFQDWALNAPFHSVFTPIPGMKLKEATLSDKLLYDRARKKNLWIPSLPQRLLFERRIQEQDVEALKSKHFDFNEWSRGHTCYMSSFNAFGTFSDTLYAQLFHPVAEVSAVIDRYYAEFSSHTIGMHIRRTDHVLSIQNSPDYLFIEKAEEEIATHSDTKIFLATDSCEVKNLFSAKFGNRILMQEDEASRDSINGIRGGLIDMYTLSRTCKIYGSMSSMFSLIASKLGENIELEILSKK